MADAGLTVSEHQAGANSDAPLTANMSPDAASVAAREGDTAPAPATTGAEAKTESSTPSESADRGIDTAEPPPRPVTVIAVHGNGGSSHRFSLVIPQMPAGVQMVAVTLPGFGGRSADASLCSISDYARNLGEIIARSPRPRVLLGHGIGGSIVLQLAQRQDVELDGVILHSPVGAHLNSRWLPWIMAFPRLRSLALRVFVSPSLRPIFRWVLFTRAAPQTYVDRFFDDYGACSVFGEMFDIITPEWFGQLRSIQAPSALVWGMAERVLPVDHLDAFRSLLPEALVLRVPGWGHFPMAESPRSYADEIAELAQVLVARNNVRGVEAETVRRMRGIPAGEAAAPESART